jgi:type II secretory pathway component HofQ
MSSLPQAALALLLTLGVAPPKEKPSAETPAARLRLALDQTVDLEIVDQPLELAIKQMSDQTKVNFVLDRTASVLLMQQGDVTQQQIVNLQAHKIKLRSALRNLLAPLNMTHVILGDTVLITGEDMAVVRQLRQRVSFDFEGVPLAEAVRQLARETATNVIVDSKVGKAAETPVSLQLDDVPFETAVRLLAEAAGLKPVRMANVLYVTTKGNAQELRSETDLIQPGRQAEGIQDMLGRFNLGGLIPGGGAPLVPPPPAPIP